MLGKRIREARESAKLKQAELARRVGVQPVSMYKIESGRSTPGLDLLMRIAAELGVSLDSLVFDESDLPPGIDGVVDPARREGAA
jgi:transcriptional regulator with XRE-family HTH domain